MDIGFTQTSKIVRWRLGQMNLRGSQITVNRCPFTWCTQTTVFHSATEDTRDKIQDNILPFSKDIT